MDVKNPFLFDEPAPSEPQDVGNNPFLSGGAFDYTDTTYSGFNPFSDQIDETSTNTVNIFGEQPIIGNDINPFGDIFASTNPLPPTTSDPPAFDIFGSNAFSQPTAGNLFGIESQSKVPPPRPPSPAKNIASEGQTPFAEYGNGPERPPPPRPPPPSKETKDLLQTVIGAIEANTDTLQDKLNTTRTPCPSPGSGAHGSRSPTPDIQITAPEKSSDAFSAIFGQTIELSDQEIDENQTQPKQETKEPTTSSNEEIDLFGDPTVQTKPKTTQDILSLFNKPMQSEQQQVDLLSGDLITNEDDLEESKQDVTAESGEDTNITLAETVSESSPFDIVSPQTSDINEVDNNSSEIVLEVQPPEVSSPDLISEKSDTEEPTVIEASIKKTAVDEGETPAIQDPTNNVQNTDATEHVQEDEIFADQSSIPASIFDSPFEDSCQIAPPETTEIPPETESPEDFPPPPPPLSESSDIYFPAPPRKESLPPVNFEEEPVIEAESSPPPFEKPAEITDRPAEILPEQTDHSTPSSAEMFPEVPSQPTQTETNTFESFNSTSVAFSSTAGEGAVSGPFDMPTCTTTDTPFGPVSGLETTGAAIFESTPLETTGAALFDSAPAPNVGMSLFGGGQEAALDIFAESESNTMVNPFAPTSPLVPSSPAIPTLAPSEDKANVVADDAFDAFSARFDSAVGSGAAEPESSPFDPFGSNVNRAPSPWGGDAGKTEADAFGFGDNAQFDSFLSMNEPPPVPQSTPRKMRKQESGDSDDGHMTVVIKSDIGSVSPMGASPVPILAPPPAATYTDVAPRFNPFDRGVEDASTALPKEPQVAPKEPPFMQRSESQETPPTPLFEEDQSVPLEPFIRTNYDGRTWEMFLRQPNKKKITGQRFWKKIQVKLTDAGALQLYNNLDDKEPFQELPLQPCYSVSDIGAQQFDQFGKIFTVKLQYIFYKERPGVRPGQISKAERITTKLSKFAQYAIAGDYEGVKEFASDVRKLGMPVEHAPQLSQLLKLGTQNYEELKLFASLIEEFMFKLTSSRDRALTYKTEEVQLTAVDELYVEQDLNGVVDRMLARVRIFFLGFLSGMPEVDLGINDLKKQGREVVGRHDIIPIVTEEWIRLEDIEFHNTVDNDVFSSSRHIKFKPPDGCYIELMRFRVRPPKNRELPLRVTTKMIIQNRKVEVNCEILVPGFSGRKLGQVPCEDVAVRFPIPECWIYMFRVEKHFRYGSVKSAHRRTGKVKGIERIKGTMESAELALMEVTSGQAKYEHQHRSIVWRISRLPKEGQGAYTVHTFTCKMSLTDFDQMPESLDKHCFVEFTMPATTVSHCVMRSVSVTSEEPPEKYVRYLARHEYKVEVEFSSGTGPNQYIAATMKQQPEVAKQPPPPPLQEESSSDESS